MVTFNGYGTCTLRWWQPKPDWSSETFTMLVTICEGDTPEALALRIRRGLDMGHYDPAPVVVDWQFVAGTYGQSHVDWLAEVLHERAELRTNLKHTQKRCTELIDETRAQRRVLAERDNDVIELRTQILELRGKLARLEVR